MTLSKRHRAELRPSENRWEAAVAKVAAEGRCRACGSRSGLQAAHTIPRSLGGGFVAESVIPLCADCHARQHAGNLRLGPLLEAGEWAEAERVVGAARAHRYLTREGGS